MSINYNPQIVTSGLVLCLDAANAKSFDFYENLYTYSEQLDNANWTKADSTIASNQTIAPDGTFTADKLIDNINNNWHAVYQSINYTGNVTASIYAKYSNRQYLKFVTNNDNATDRGATFDLINKTVTNTSAGVTATIVDIGDGWVRVSVTSYSTGGGSRYYNWALATNSAGTYIYIGDGNGSVFLWGAQLEKSSTASRYYATTGTAKNRATSLTDISGNGIVGTLTNGPTYNALNNGSIVFDGVDDYGECASTIFTATGNCTIGIWCKSNNYVTQAGITGNKAYYATGQGLAIGNISNPTRPYLIINTDTETKNISFTDASTYGWSYFVGVKSANNINAYTNGVLVNSTTYNGAVITDYSSNISIGRYLGSSRRWDGSLSHIQYYNKALSTSEILQNFNALRGRFGI